MARKQPPSEQPVNVTVPTTKPYRLETRVLEGNRTEIVQSGKLRNVEGRAQKRLKFLAALSEQNKKRG